MFTDVVLPKRSFEDLHRLVSEVSYIMRLATEDEIEFANHYDSDVFELFLRFAENIGVTPPAQLQSEIFHLLECLGELKRQFRMPRPKDIALRLGRQLPRSSTTKWERSFSYPSGHTLISRYLAYRLGSQDEVTEAQRHALFDLANRIALSRVHLGVHSLQDIREARRLVDSLFAYSRDLNGCCGHEPEMRPL